MYKGWMVKRGELLTWKNGEGENKGKGSSLTIGWGCGITDVGISVDKVERFNDRKGKFEIV